MNSVLLIETGNIIQEAISMGIEERYSATIIIPQVVFLDNVIC